jgi:hypothetical protein
MGWQELLALASIPSGLLALYSMYTAYERWRVWAHHGHHCDAALTAPDCISSHRLAPSAR